MKNIISLCYLLLISGFVFGQEEYRYVIYTDESPPTKAQEIIDLFSSSPPFNEFDLSFEVRSMTTEELNCRTGEGSLTRLITCDSYNISNQAFEDGFDQAMVVVDHEHHGGSGGSVPVVSSSSTATIMFHEYLHTLGFCDEYIYANQNEADRYCRESLLRSYINAAIIEPLPDGYSGDPHARNEHADEIPWYELILEETPIASSTLGTPTSFLPVINTVEDKNSAPSNNNLSTVIGLFESNTCRESSRAIRLWKPGADANIMSGGSTTLDEYVPLVRLALSSVINSRGSNGANERGVLEKGNDNCPEQSLEQTAPLQEKDRQVLEQIQSNVQ